jgi:hypothetical protein
MESGLSFMTALIPFIRNNYRMAAPALAKPVIVVATSMPAVTSAANTISSRVPAAMGILNPVVMPLEMDPMPTIPVSVGDSTTIAPGMGKNILSGAADA